MRRCLDARHKDYARYGGRGIRVCERIRSGSHTLKAIIGLRPDGLTLDRKDNDAGYTCGRCQECRKNGWDKNIQWATRLHQARNQSRIRLIEINGEAKCIAEWAQVTGIHYMTLMTRYNKGQRGEELIRRARPVNRK